MLPTKYNIDIVRTIIDKALIEKRMHCSDSELLRKVKFQLSKYLVDLAERQNPNATSIEAIKTGVTIADTLMPKVL